MGLVKKVKWEMKKHLAIQILWQNKTFYLEGWIMYTDRLLHVQ